MIYKNTALIASFFFTCLQQVSAQKLPDVQPFVKSGTTSNAGLLGEKPLISNPAQVAALSTDPTSTSAALPVRGFTFLGHAAYSSNALLGILNLPIPEQGVLSISFEDLSVAVDRITKFYREQGYVVARAYLPKQASTNGVIQIRVLEGYHTKSSLSNTSPVGTPRLRAMLNDALCQNQRTDCVGALVGDEWNERALRLLNDLPGVAATAQLEPGLLLGSSLLNIQAKASSLPVGQISVDNYGSRVTGLYRLAISRDFNNLNHDGDQLTLSASASKQHIWSANLSYSVLAGNAGARVGMSAAHGQYLLGDTFAALKAHGESNSLTLFASYPLIRHRERNLSVRGALEYKALKDSIELGDKHFDKRAHTYGVSLFGDRVDALLGGGYNTLSISAMGGYLRLLDADSQANDALAKTAGSYQKLSFLLSRQQALMGSWTLYTAAQGVSSNKNLDGSEKMALGGPSSVRGYPLGEAAGDKGAVANLELRWTKPLDANKTITFSTFIDRGWVQTSITPWTGLASQSTRALTGYGLGVLLIKPFDYNIRMLYGTHRAGEPSTIDPANKYQLWLQASKSF